jgi:rubrerythrin
VSQLPTQYECVWTIPLFADLNDPDEVSMLRGMVEPITDVEDLRRHLQWAIEVEHSTIPPYEYAMWSVVDPDSEAGTSIKYVAREEMLHAALAANLLTAVGGAPRFTGDAVPRYPEPMRHHDPKQPLVLHLAPASVELIGDVFLRIEQPEERGAKPEADRYETLAQFYEAIVAALARLGEEIFTGDPRRQVTKGYAGHGGGALFAITDVDSALLSIEVIVEQGEGTHTSAFAPVGFDPTRIDHLRLEPFGFEGTPEPAHYWRFLNIVEGKTPLGDVHPMRLDPSTGDLPEGELHDLCRLFDACYSLQMDVMERVWRVGDESPLIDAAMVPLMNHAEKPIALALVREPWPDGSGDVAGPPFAWDPMPLAEMRELARRLGARFELGPTVETLDQVAAALP